MTLTHKLAACVAVCVVVPALGCAGSKPAVAPTVTGQSTATPTAGPATQPQATASASNVNISDEILRKCGISQSDAYFSFDSAHVTSQDIRPLDLVATCFISGPLAGKGMQLVGHADPRGPEEYNLLLGHKRADAVQAYLDGRGLDKSKAETTSRGAMDATGQDESGWAKDRRVDVLLAQ